jgi:hypothetical protein
MNRAKLFLSTCLIWTIWYCLNNTQLHVQKCISLLRIMAICVFNQSKTTKVQNVHGYWILAVIYFDQSRRHFWKLWQYHIVHITCMYNRYIFITNVIETRFMPLPSLLTTFHNLSWLPNDCATTKVQNVHGYWILAVIYFDQSRRHFWKLWWVPPM